MPNQADNAAELVGTPQPIVDSLIGHDHQQIVSGAPSEAGSLKLSCSNRHIINQPIARLDTASSTTLSFSARIRPAGEPHSRRAAFEMIQRHHRHPKTAITDSSQISQILFITAILTVVSLSTRPLMSALISASNSAHPNQFFGASEPLLTANGQQPDWLGSAGSWPYKFASARYFYTPEAIKPEPSRSEAISRQHETKLNLSSTGGRLDRPARPESRYSYELASASSTIRPLSSIQVQLAELRRQLDTELASEELRRQVALGSACLRASDCSNSIKGSHCKLDTFTCSCLPYYVEFNSTTCLPRKCLPMNVRA